MKKILLTSESCTHLLQVYIFLGTRTLVVCSCIISVTTVSVFQKVSWELENQLHPL